MRISFSVLLGSGVFFHLFVKNSFYGEPGNGLIQIILNLLMSLAAQSMSHCADHSFQLSIKMAFFSSPFISVLLKRDREALTLIAVVSTVLKISC